MTQNILETHLLDQNLEIVNKLKSSQMGYTKKDYLRNHGIERRITIRILQRLFVT